MIAAQRSPRARLATLDVVMESGPVLGLAAVLPSIVLGALSLARGGHGLWNDFASYWVAARLVASGHTPYDLGALVRLGAVEGVIFEAGTGYSYPPPFAVAMVPLAALPFVLAASVFTALSLGVFALAVAGWLRDRRMWRAPAWQTLAVALAAGLYTPVHASVFFGQANLLVFGALALGVRLLLRPDRDRTLAGGIWLGIGGIVKVAPLALALPLALAGRLRGLLGVAAGASAALVAAVVVAPFTLTGVDRLGGLGAPDPYWTNQSINGFASRLTLGSDRTVAVLPGIDAATLATASLVAFGILTLGVLTFSRPSLAAPSGVALAIGFTLVAAVAGAPKNSFWNHVPVLIGALLLLSPMIRGPGLHGTERVLLAAWYGLTLLQWWVDSLGAEGLRSLGGAGTVLSGSALLGLLTLWAALGIRLLAQRPGIDPARRPATYSPERVRPPSRPPVDAQSRGNGHMNLRTIAAATGIIGVVYGLGFLAAPEPIADLLGVDLNEAGVLTSRFLGAYLIALGAVDWLAQGALERGGSGDVRNALVTGNLLGSVVSTGLAVWGVSAGLSNQLGWVNVFVTALIAVAWGYYGIVRQDGASA